MFKGVTFDIKRSVIAGAIVLFLVYLLAHGASFFTGKPLLEMFESVPYLSGLLGLTGLAATLDHQEWRRLQHPSDTLRLRKEPCPRSTRRLPLAGSGVSEENRKP